MTAAASRWQGFGTTIFTEMSALAERTGAINLGQGFPDDGRPGRGARGRRAGDPRRRTTSTRRCRASRRCARRSPPTSARFYGIEVDPDDRGAGHLRRHRGDRGRAAGAAASRATRSSRSSPTTTPTRRGSRWPARVRRPVTLRAPDWTHRPRRAARPRSRRSTRVLLLNSPHNPTGKVLSRAELELIAAACRRARPDRRHRRGLRAPRLRRRARPARDAAGHGRADADDLLARQDVLGHGLEDRLGGRAARSSWRPRARPSSS